MNALPVIFAPEGLALTERERAFFTECRPSGFILFKRNCDTPDQVQALTSALRELVADETLPILIDQEGGRVQRLGAPHWKARPSAAAFGELWKTNPEVAQTATALNAELIARELLDLGINVDCLPLLDVARPETHLVIGDRAFGADPDMVASLGRAQMEGLQRGGVLPVIKHIPGHGRATVDSHHDLPRVAAPLEELRAQDFVPFAACADAPFGMTAHIVFDAVDEDRPATNSPRVIQDIIREEIGFGGILMSDDLGMNALPGNLSERAANVLAAGCDLVLHCSGKIDEMQAVASVLEPMDDVAASRLASAIGTRQNPGPLDIDAHERMLEGWLVKE